MLAAPRSMEEIQEAAPAERKGSGGSNALRGRSQTVVTQDHRHMSRCVFDSLPYVERYSSPPLHIENYKIDITSRFTEK